MEAGDESRTGGPIDVPFGGADRRRAPQYSGADRRRAAMVEPEPLGGAFVAVTVALVLAYGLLLIGPLAEPAYAVGDPELLRALLDAAGFALAALVGALCVVRWRASGEASSLWLGAAFLLYAIVTVGLRDLLPLVMGEGLGVLRWLQPASRLVVLALLVRAVASPPVDSRLAIWRVAGITAAATAALAIGFRLAPPLAAFVSGAGDPVPDAGTTVVGTYLVAAAWFAVALMFSVRGIRAHLPLFAWLGLTLAGLGFAELSLLIDADATSLWSAGASMLRIGSLLCATIVGLRELQYVIARQSSMLHKSVATHLATQARLRAATDAAEERAHEARNALTAIEAATRTLEHYRDQLDDEQRTQLAGAVSTEIARLQALVSAEAEEPKAPSACRPAEAIAPIVSLARSEGVQLSVDVPHELQAQALADDVAEIVQNLLRNAQRYAPASDVHLTGRRDGLGVSIRVSDRGQGVAEGEREKIFSRGARGSAADGTDGSGLGLYVCERLARSHGGRLWVEERPGGGAAFILWLPSAGPAGPALQEALDQREEGGKIRRRRQHLVALPGADVTLADPVGGGGQLDDHVGGDPAR